MLIKRQKPRENERYNTVIHFYSAEAHKVSNAPRNAYEPISGVHVNHWKGKNTAMRVDHGHCIS